MTAAAQATQAETLLKTCLGLLRQDPRNPELRQLLGQLGQAPALTDDSRIAAFEALAQTAPDDFMARNDLACALFRAERFEAATVLFRQLLDIQPGFHTARLNLGISLLRGGQPEQAFETFLDLRQIDPELVARTASLAIGEAEILGMAGIRPDRFAAAADALRQYLRFHPQSISAISWAALALLFDNRPDEAEALLRQAADQPADDDDFKAMLKSSLDMTAWYQAVKAGQYGCPDMSGDGERYVIPIAVWGESYIRMMEDFALPCLLAEGNLPAIARRGSAHVLILTWYQHFQRIDQSPIVAAIRKIAPCSVIALPPLSMHQYRMMTLMHWTAIRYAQAQGAHLFSWSPDVVISNAFLSTLDDKRRDGADIVFVDALLADSTAVLDHCRRIPRAPDAPLSLSAGDSVGLAQDHPHPLLALNHYQPVGTVKAGYPVVWPIAAGSSVETPRSGVRPMLA